MGDAVTDLFYKNFAAEKYNEEPLLEEVSKQRLVTCIHCSLAYEDVYSVNFPPDSGRNPCNFFLFPMHKKILSGKKKLSEILQVVLYTSTFNRYQNDDLLAVFYDR